MSGLLASAAGTASVSVGEVFAVVVVVAATKVAAGDTATAVGDDGGLVMGFSGTVSVFFKSCCVLSTIST